MTYRWLDDLDAALTAAGVPYVEINEHPSDYTHSSSWRVRGRPASTGQFDPRGVLCHHTASPAGTTDAADINVLMYGNGSAPGPISQIYLGRTATVYLLAAGRANHGGSGRRPGIDTGGCADMNAALVGIEAGNAGTGAEYWPDPMTTMYGRLVAALCAYYGWSVHDDVYLHATTGPPSGGCNQKIDPAGPWQGEPANRSTWNLETWRAWCSSTQPPTPQPPPLEGADMPAWINKGTNAVFAMTGGQCHWIPTAADADALGVPAPDAAGRRGVMCSDEFFRNLILVGPLPEEPGWWAGHFRAWWPDGTPANAQTAYPADTGATRAAMAPPDNG